MRLGLTMANSTAKTRELSGRQSVVDFERASRRSQDTETLPDNPTDEVELLVHDRGLPPWSSDKTRAAGIKPKARIRFARMPVVGHRQGGRNSTERKLKA